MQSALELPKIIQQQWQSGQRTLNTGSLLVFMVSLCKIRKEAASKSELSRKAATWMAWYHWEFGLHFILFIVC